VEFFHSPNIDWLGKKWYFLGFSLIFSIAGILSMMFWHRVPLSVDFRGGTQVVVKFTATPSVEQVRSLLTKAGLKNPSVVTYDKASTNQLLIGLEQSGAGESALDKDKNDIIRALETNVPEGKQDFNNAAVGAIAGALQTRDPLRNGGDEKAYTDLAHSIAGFRDNKDHGGAVRGLDELSAVAPPAVVSALQQDFFASNFHAGGAEIVGPQVGAQLRDRAVWAIGLSLLGMLVYLWFRFELIYGVAAVVACFHDTLITVGAFSLANKEISLTVVAAILTLVGYSMNDTIVVFDRIRENVKLLRRERLDVIVNRSINQTLSRTILTSGLTFLTVLSLFAFGGEVLHGFSFALVIGILIGTYSSIAVAAPMLVAYQDWRSRRGGGRPVPVVVEGKRRDRVRAKA
jgi:preprotein translocase subunit SecF